MSFLGIIGGLLLFMGVVHLRTCLQRKRWPVVAGTLDSVDLKIEPTGPTEVVGFFFQPKFIHKIRYSYRNHSYVVELSGKEVIAENLKLRVNPEKPSEAFLDNKTLVLPLLAIGIGIILIIGLIKYETTNN